MLTQGRALVAASLVALVASGACGGDDGDAPSGSAGRGGNAGTAGDAGIDACTGAAACLGDARTDSAGGSAGDASWDGAHDASESGTDASDARSDATDAGTDASDTGSDGAGDGGSGEAEAGITCEVLRDTVPLAAQRDVTCPGVPGPTEVVAGSNGMLYLFSSSLNRIFPWSARTGSCGAPIQLAFGPQHVAYSRVSHKLYVAGVTGAITSIDPDTGSQQPFASTPLGATALTTAGQYVVAIDGSGEGTQYVFSPSGVRLSAVELKHTSPQLEWSDANRRVYYLRNDIWRNVQFASIDCTTGAIASPGGSPYDDAFDIRTPLRVAPNGTRILAGTEVYHGLTLQRLDGIAGTFTDAAWLSTDQLLVLREHAGATLLEQRGGAVLRTQNVQLFRGEPVAVRALGDGAVVVTRVAGVPTMSVYHANADGDRDGIAYANDAFPLDAAASQDSDYDGYPNAWNAGSAASTTGLTLDAFPSDSACHSSSQAFPGDSTRCDIARMVPTYMPDALVFDGQAVIYLLSRANQHVYRYSVTSSQHLNPFVWRATPTLMDYSAAHNRLYVGYDDGSLSSIPAGGGKEEELAVLPYAVQGLAAAGQFLLAADESGAWLSHFTFNASGRVITWAEWNYLFNAHAWSPANSRLYFFRDETVPNDLHYEVVDQVSGRITSKGETPYHGEYEMGAPIRVSRDGRYVLIGTGHIYNGNTLVHERTLAVPPVDATWLADNTLVTFTADGTLRWFNSAFVAGKTVAVPGAPLRVFAGPTHLVAVTQNAGKPAFHQVSY
ncbi:MAG TPA: hypothetical protein VI072_17725 [Polyangiaceae bacterium]